jgi:hypothetical protein
VARRRRAAPGGKTITYLAGFASWEAGAVVMTRAIVLEGNPHEPADRIVVPLAWPGVAVIRYVGERT